MPSQRDHVTAKFLELAVTADESADTFNVTDVKFYFSRQKLDAADGFDVPFTTAAAANAEVELGTVLPPPTVIRLKSTFVA